MAVATLKASLVGKQQIKQARERKGWTVSSEDTRPLKEASKFLVEQHAQNQGWDDNDERWLRDFERLFRIETDQEINELKMMIFKSKQSSFLGEIIKLIDANQIFFKNISYGTWSRFASQTKGDGIKESAFKAYCHILELDWKQIVISNENNVIDCNYSQNLPTRNYTDFIDRDNDIAVVPNQSHKQSLAIYQDWGNAPDVSTFFGRETELETLKTWILQERCRLIAILGIGGIGKTRFSLKLSGRDQLTQDGFNTGGIGKTDLSLKLAQEIQQEFQYVIWRSLRNAPPLRTLLGDLIKFLSNEQEVDLLDTSEPLDDQIARLISYLNKARCLIILDNAETLFQERGENKKYLPGYEGYDQLFEKIGECLHQSCFIVTSRQKPPAIELLEGEKKLTRSLALQGLDETSIKQLLSTIGQFSGSTQDWQNLVELYKGNPLALEVVATQIQAVFDGNIAAFLEEGTSVFGKLHDVLDWHFERLSAEEREILYWLTIHREPIGVSDLKDEITTSSNRNKLPLTWQSLLNKFIIDKQKGGSKFTLQPVLMEYVVEKIIDQVVEEFKTRQFKVFKNHALILAQVKDYIREGQIRIILKPVEEKLLEVYHTLENLENQAKDILNDIRNNHLQQSDYVAGNIINLLCYLKVDLTAYDFSHLTIWQAYLQGVELRSTNFTASHFKKTLFTQPFGGIWAIAFSPDGNYLAIGDFDGSVHLLQVHDGHLLETFQTSCWGIMSVAFSPDGRKLVSSGLTSTIYLWDITEKHCKVLEGHTDWVWSVVFSADGQTIASCSDDGTVKLWDAQTGQCFSTFKGSHPVVAVAFSPDSQFLASSGVDPRIKLWDLETGHCCRIFEGHKDQVWSLAFSPNGQTIASCGFEHTVRLWHIETGELSKVLTGHTSGVKTLSFSPDGETLASGSFEPSIRFWDVETGECCRVIKGHLSGIRSLAFSPNSEVLATGDMNQVLKLWDTRTGECFRTLTGYTNEICCGRFSLDGTRIISSHLDHKIRIWDISSGECLKVLEGHKTWIYYLTLSFDGKTIASCGDASNVNDITIRLWDQETGEHLYYLHSPENGFEGGVWALAFSPDSQFLASGGQGSIVKLWNLKTRKCIRVFQGHTNWVWSLAFSPDSQYLISGSSDHSIKIWEIQTGECLVTLQGHSSLIWSVAVSSDGRLLASGSADRTVKLWDLKTYECLHTFQGHENAVSSIAFTANGHWLISGSEDCTLKVWKIDSGECLKTLRGHTGKITSVALSSDQQIIASTSSDESIRLWDIETGKCLKVLRLPRPYEGMNITKITGLEKGQKTALKLLGAIEFI